jgi:hypothetical protein
VDQEHASSTASTPPDPAKQFFGLALKHGIDVDGFQVEPAHFQRIRRPGYAVLFERMRRLGPVGIDEIETEAPECYEMAVEAVRDAPDVDDPEDCLQSLAIRIRGHNEPPELKSKPAPSAPKSEPRKRQNREDAKIIKGGRSMEWFSKIMKRENPLTHSQAHTLGFIFAHISGGEHGKGDAWPSLRTIAKGTGSDKRTIISNLDYLVEEGILAVDPPSGDRKSNTYRMALPPDLAKK